MALTFSTAKAKTGRNGATSHKTDYDAQIEDIINLETNLGYRNQIIGIKVMVILLDRWIFPIGKQGYPV